MSIEFLLTQTGSLYAVVDGDDGNPSYSGTASTASVPCRVEVDNTQLQQPDKTTIITDALIFVGPDTTVEVGYKMVIGDDNYIVLAVITERLVNTVDHKELMCRRLSDA